MLTSVFDKLGRAISRSPRATIGIWAVFTVACYLLAVIGVGGQTLFERLSTGEPSVPGSDSAIGAQILQDGSVAGPSLTLVVTGVDPAASGLAAPVAEARERLQDVRGVATVIDPYQLPDGPADPAAAPLLGTDGESFLMVVELTPDLPADTEEAALATVEQELRSVPRALTDVAPGATGTVGGTSLIVTEITDQVEEDLTTGEAVALPIALVVMVLVFGGFLSAAMPMAGAIASIASGLGSVFLLSYWMDMGAAVVNVVTVLGLGLSIDYGLLIVSRFREELTLIVAADEGRSVRRRRGDGAVETALRRAMQTAGRTVTISALTVGVAISALLIFSPSMLRAFGAAGVAVVVVAVLTALTLVPALMVLAGRRLVRPGIVGRIPGLRTVLAHTSDVVSSEGVFSRLGARVQRRPWTVLGVCLVILGVLAAPVTGLQLRNSTIELLPAGSEQRQYVELLAERYPGSAGASVIAVAEAPLERVAPWAASLEDLPDVEAVDPPVPSGGYVVVGVRPDAADPGGTVAQDVVHVIRGTDPAFPVWVTGQAANQIDFVDALVERAPTALIIIGVATLVLLFLLTGSVVVPIKALLMNVISLGASLGVLVWAFQDGHLAGPLGFTAPLGIETYVVALVIAFGFGLAMDYEVFLLSRIKELWDRGETNDDAVRLGLQRSGRIITSAALIIIVVFGGFVFGEMLVIKEVGFALAVAVFIDATLVRLLLVPATMTLLGRYNWWAPRWLRAVHRRVAVEH